VEVYTVLINVFFGKKWVALKRAGWAGCWLALKRIGCWVVLKMVSQTSQILFEMITICPNTSFESCSPLVSCIVHHALLELTPCLNHAADVATRLFCISLGGAVIFFRWSGQIYCQLVLSFLRSLYTKNYWNRFIFDWVVPKIRRGCFGTRCRCTAIY